MPLTSYALALGSNRRSRWGTPAATVRHAAASLGVTHLSKVRATPALGPAGRSFANAAAILTSPLRPAELLAHIKDLERALGRRPGRRWGARVIDIDIILWSEGPFDGPGLGIPHPEFRRRAFVLEPLVEIASGWRDPKTGLTVRQLAARLAARRPVDPAAPRT